MGQVEKCTYEIEQRNFADLGIDEKRLRWLGTALSIRTCDVLQLKNPYEFINQPADFDYLLKKEFEKLF